MICLRCYFINVFKIDHFIFKIVITYYISSNELAIRLDAIIYAIRLALRFR